MSEKPNGGHAFPRPQTAAVGHKGWEATPGYDGMTLRDWFAGQAMVGMLANTPTNDGDNWPDSVNLAANAYRYADAMIAERNK